MAEGRRSYARRASMSCINASKRAMEFIGVSPAGGGVAPGMQFILKARSRMVSRETGGGGTGGGGDGPPVGDTGRRGEAVWKRSECGEEDVSNAWAGFCGELDFGLDTPVCVVRMDNAEPGWLLVREA